MFVHVANALVAHDFPKHNSPYNFISHIFQRDRSVALSIAHYENYIYTIDT